MGLLVSLSAPYYSGRGRLITQVAERHPDVATNIIDVPVYCSDPSLKNYPYFVTPTKLNEMREKQPDNIIWARWQNASWAVDAQQMIEIASGQSIGIIKAPHSLGALLTRNPKFAAAGITTVLISPFSYEEVSSLRPAGDNPTVGMWRSRISYQLGDSLVNNFRSKGKPLNAGARSFLRKARFSTADIILTGSLFDWVLVNHEVLFITNDGGNVSDDAVEDFASILQGKPPVRGTAEKWPDGLFT